MHQSAEAAGPNTLRFDNKSGSDAVVRVFDEASGKRVAEVKIPDGRMQGTSISAGRYYIVAKYAPMKGENKKAGVTYAKGDPFDMKPPPGKILTTTITLHRVVNGNYSSVPTTENEFEK
jgi:hypothetical protein